MEYLDKLVTHWKSIFHIVNSKIPKMFDSVASKCVESYQLNNKGLYKIKVYSIYFSKNWTMLFQNKL